jgi:hypothetical protein
LPAPSLNTKIHDRVSKKKWYDTETQKKKILGGYKQRGDFISLLTKSGGIHRQLSDSIKAFIFKESGLKRSIKIMATITWK